MTSWHYPNCTCQAKHFDWNFIDSVYCICLQERPDRLAESQQQFHNVELCNRVVYYRPTLDKSTHVKRPAARGGWESHRFVIKTAKERKERYALIFEDDAYFTEQLTPDRLRDFANRMKSLPSSGWDLYFLGHFPLFAVPASLDLRIWRVWSAMCHAYIINTDGALAQWVIDTPYDSLPQGKYGHPCIDMMFAKRGKGYAYYPMLCLQSESKSSNPKKYPLSWVTDWILHHSKNTATVMEWMVYFGPTILLVILATIITMVVTKRLPRT